VQGFVRACDAEVIVDARYTRRMRVAIALVVLAVVPARAEPVDPAKLAPIAVTAPGTGEHVQVFAAGVDADVVLYALDAEDFVMLAGAKPVDGRLGDGKPVTASAAFHAIAAGLDVAPLHRTTGSHPVDLEVYGASTQRMLQFLSDVAGTSYVFAAQHELPPVTIRAHHVDPRELARAIARLVHVELVETNGVWVIAEPGIKLDKRLAAATRAKSRIEINHAHPGEARRLLDPDVTQDHNACPKDTWIDASLHGETGVLDAVLAALPGPPCEQKPNNDELDTATATLVGILVEPKARRAVFRVPHGARTFEPTTGTQRVEINYVVVRADETAPLHGTSKAISSDFVAPGPFATADRTTWHLRGTVRVGKTWKAMFRSQSEWRVAPGPGILTPDAKSTVDITAGTASVKPVGYALER
jgi:hypothetical protein